ncbi:nucleoside hydrolase [Actinotalea sp. AC32]|nr:nucleoside hydrolase [Actinotalea sp. AC32]
MTSARPARPRRGLSHAALAVALGSVVLAACSPASDADGEPVRAGTLAAAPATLPDAVPTVVDTDLGGDDLVALAYLLRHPGVDVRAITVATTGLAFHCGTAVDLVADLLVALDEPAVPIACGRPQRGERGTPFPAAWRVVAAEGSGLRRDAASLPTEPATAAELLADAALDADGRLHVVALGPLTNVAETVRTAPEAWHRLAGVTAMGGVVEGPAQDHGVGEWNSAADPEALDVVLAAEGVPVVLVPADAVPTGTPDALRAPVVGDVVAARTTGTWWDPAAAATFAEPDLASCDPGTWEQDASEPGRLRRTAPDGHVCVRRDIDLDALARTYAEVLAVDKSAAG